jgi:uncharacterized protein with HEPN domain
MVNAVQEIGRAAAKVSLASRTRITEISWKAVVGMRNRLVHGYDEIDLDVLWMVASKQRCR